MHHQIQDKEDIIIIKKIENTMEYWIVKNGINPTRGNHRSQRRNYSLGLCRLNWLKKSNGPDIVMKNYKRNEYLLIDWQVPKDNISVKEYK